MGPGQWQVWIDVSYRVPPYRNALSKTSAFAYRVAALASGILITGCAVSTLNPFESSASKLFMRRLDQRDQWRPAGEVLLEAWERRSGGADASALLGERGASPRLHLVLLSYSQHYR